MNHIFISCSAEDRRYADHIIQLLNANVLTTWIAPDSIPAGADHPASIIDAIKAADAVVLILSAHSLNSFWVATEMERAVNYHKRIFPVQVDNAPLTSSMELKISSRQIVPFRNLYADQNTAERFLAAIRAAVDNSEEEPMGPQPPIRDEIYHEIPSDQPPIQDAEKKKRKKKLAGLIIAVVILSVLLIVIGKLFFHGGDGRDDPSETTTASSQSTVLDSGDHKTTNYTKLKLNGLTINLPISYQDAKERFGFEGEPESETNKTFSLYYYQTKFGYPMLFHSYDAPSEFRADSEFFGISVTDAGAVITLEDSIGKAHSISPGMTLTEVKSELGQEYQEYQKEELKEEIREELGEELGEEPDVEYQFAVYLVNDSSSYYAVYIYCFDTDTIDQIYCYRLG